MAALKARKQRRAMFQVCAVLFATTLLVACTGPTEQQAQWDSWQSYAGHPDSSQYSSLNQINRDNVTQLTVAWTFPAGDGNHRGAPIVVGDVMYVVANNGVAALDAASGEQRWFAPDVIAPYARGLTFWASEDNSDQRLLVIKEHYLQALDAQTGEIISSFGNKGRVDLRLGLNRDPESITRIASMTPGRVFENLIILGSAVGDDAYDPAPGDIRAFDVRSGDPVWTFHTIPHPGEAGYETWPPEAWKSIGAANTWSAMSLDAERGIVYAPTGAPSYHFYGANRVGDNLYANSLIALDARTGERLWHFQAIHHDIWDYDLAMAPKLLTVERDGRKIAAVALAGKHGFLFVFDRVTGAPVFPIEERPVPQSDVPGEQTSPTQPFPVDLAPFANLTLTADNLSPYADPEERDALAKRIQEARNEGLFTPPSFQGSVNAPGSRGGAQFGNGAVIPDAGLFYLAVIESPTIPKLEERQEFSADASIAEIYSSTCAGCHGPEGKGQPPLFPAIAGIASRLSDDDFVRVVKEGRGRMAAFPHLPDGRLAGLLEYLDQLETSSDGATAVMEAETAPRVIADDDRRYRSGYHHFFSDTGLLGPPPWSKLVAYDLNLGKILWQKPYGDVIELAERGITGTGSLFPTNSLTATAGGLLFSATNDRKLRAWDRETGQVLWSVSLPADPGGIPAVYEINGRQYVVATATRGDTGEPAYIAFSLPVEPSSR
jgi:quinoprotein glucose dehydrogenase